MTVFAEPAPRLYALPPGVDFARLFAAGFHARLGQLTPEEVARTTILVNTTRAMRAIEEALADIGPGILPRMVLMSELHADPLRTPDLPPSLSPLRRRLRLTRLVEGFLRAKASAGERMAPLSAAPDLADSLALLIDQFHDEGVPSSRLEESVAGADLAADAARHWQETLSFVDLVRTHWPRIRAELEGGALDPRARQRAVIEAMVADWLGEAPRDPVIAAGSTGSVGSTADVLAAVARLPAGAVVLPGFDPGTDAAIWQSVGPEHPLGPFGALFSALDLGPDAVGYWHGVEETPRRRLMTQALRPAPVTDHWPLAAPALRAEVAGATQGLALIEAESQRHEAMAIAVAIREAIAHPGRTVTLVTPDAALARRVTAVLGRFGIVPDDTMGQPLGQSPPAVLMRLLINVATGSAGPVGIAALLQHPLTQPGLARAEHLKLARAYERAVLRRGPGAQTPLPHWPDATPESAEWLTRLCDILAPLAQALEDRAPLGQIVEAHLRAAERLTDAGDGAGPALWQGEAGVALQAFVTQLVRGADAFGPDSVPDYRALLTRLMHGEQIRPRPREPHPRVSICGPREARFEAADRIIVAGLNEGVWPEAPDPGPWLSRPMRQALGLPLPERSVGLSAHDFLNVACQPEVLLSRSKKIEGAATVASRWLIRLETLIRGIGKEQVWESIRARGGTYLEIAEFVSQPGETVARAERPRPVPPPEARPRALSVTEVERLVRDAYSVYARRVLHLRPLDPLGRAPDARDRGNLLHSVAEEFIERTRDWPGIEAARNALEAAADTVLAREVPWPDLRRIWRGRILRFAETLLDTEEARRATGTPLCTEARGAIDIGLPNGALTLGARADRIDRLHDGTAAIYDYKSSLPSPKQIENGYNQQLHIQAAILAAGGFEGVAPMTASRGAYIGLSGSASSKPEQPVENLSAEVAAHMEHVRNLLARHDTGAPYISHGRPERTRFAGDYDHLARLGEWSREEGE